MASIQERRREDGTKVYRVQIRLRGYPPETETFERKTDAKEWARNTEAAIKENRWFKNREAQRHTVTELLDRYEREILPRKRDAVTPKAHLRFWREEIGDLLLSGLTAAVIVEKRDLLANRESRRGEKYTPASLNRHVAALSHACSIAVKEWHWLDDNPVRKVSKLREARGRVRFLSEEERTRLLKACKASHRPELYPIVMLALSTGARLGEVLNLRWRHVDLNAKLATLDETKNGERRSLPISSHALPLLKELARVRRLDTDLLFPQDGADKPVDIRKAWDEAVEKAKLKDFRFHDLRHSAASYLAMNGATLAEIAAVLGHKTLSMVKRYSHLTPQHTASVVERMNQRIFGDSQ